MTKNRLVVGDMSWADMIPDWLLEEIKHERIIYGLAGISNPEAPKIGDAEVAAYLMTASMRAPMPGEYVEIYTYLTARLMKRQGKELPDFMTEKLERGLTRQEEYELNELRYMIYNKRGGEIDTPLLNAMRTLRKEIDRKETDPQLSLFERRQYDT
jgi:hypothetical protein